MIRLSEPQHLAHQEQLETAVVSQPLVDIACSVLTNFCFICKISDREQGSFDLEKKLPLIDLVVLQILHDQHTPSDPA